jgi:hypothetical protein
VIGERTRGVLLYAFAAVVLTGGAFWWFRAAPHAAVDSQIDQWRQSAERLVPDLDRQDAADTVSLAAGTEREVQANVANGSYRVTVVCVGGGDSSVRISLSDSGADSGHGLDCSGNQRPFDFPVAVAGQLRINVSVGEAGPVVFRYTVLKAEN